jgi:hypothetical protein
MVTGGDHWRDLFFKIIKVGFSDAKRLGEVSKPLIFW